MNTILSLSITFLDDLFHGQMDKGPEWPPSPYRLYQAILCAAARNGCDSDGEFQWFEALEPPDIVAPTTTDAPKRAFFVPNNDADVPSKFERQSRLTGKTAWPTRILGDATTVRYLWRIRREDQSAAQRILDRARLISAVGWGIDLAVGDGALSQAEDPAWLMGMQRWCPAARGKLLRCPVTGTLQELRDIYESFLNRIDGKYYQAPRRPNRFREVAYRTADDGRLQRPYAAFTLIRPGDDSDRCASFDPRHAMHVAAWMRGQACDLAKQAHGGFLDGYDPEQYVAGHIPADARRGPSPPRFSYLPIPTIGHERADGRIRRAIIAEPYGGPGDCVRWARKALNLKILNDECGQTKAQLFHVSPDGVLSRYTKESRVFSTVTPVVLTGHDDRDYRKTSKMVLKAIEHAGFSQDDIESVYLQKAPFFSGGFHPRDYVLPRYLKELPHSAVHVRLVWKQPIHGPLAIGAGRYFGLGLFAAER